MTPRFLPPPHRSVKFFFLTLHFDGGESPTPFPPGIHPFWHFRIKPVSLFPVDARAPISRFASLGFPACLIFFVFFVRGFVRNVAIVVPLRRPVEVGRARGLQGLVQKQRTTQQTESWEVWYTLQGRARVDQATGFPYLQRWISKRHPLTFETT